MKNIFAIAERDLKAYFTSPIAYVVLTIFLFLMGMFFYLAVTSLSQSASIGFCQFFLDACLDQVRYMRELLEPSGVRITGLVLNKVDPSSRTYYGCDDYYQDDMTTKADWRSRRRVKKVAKKAHAVRAAGSSSERSRRKERTKVGAR